MNVAKPDYIGLVKEIEKAKGKNFTVQQAESLIDEFKTLEWHEAYEITFKITRVVNLPSNPYGLVLNHIDDVKREKERERRRREREELEKQSWKPATEDCASPEEFKWTMKVIGIITRFKESERLCIENCERMKNAIDKNNLLDYLKRAYAYYSEQASKKPELLKISTPF